MHWKVWEEHYVVYNSGSGHTHLLDPIAALLVQKIAAGPGYDADEFVGVIADLLNLDVTAEFREKLEETLRKLSELGLIEAVAS